MKRIEVIANRSVEDDIMEGIENAGIREFTVIPYAHGMGKSNPKMGNSVWPEENFILIVYTDDKGAQKIRRIIADVKESFSSEGIKYFETG